MKVYLIGFMGSGKTTYGSKLAEAMGYDFIDLDRIIADKAGMPVAQIFEKDGEEKFRELETNALQGTEKLSHTVIATGGGTPCFKNQMKWLNDKGLTIYLKLFEDELYKRLKTQKDERPLLKDVPSDELQVYIYNTLRKRAYYYHQAKIVIDPAEVNAEELAQMLKEKVTA